MTRTNTRLSGEILKLAKNVQDLASAFNGNVHSILRQQRDDREQLHTFYSNMEKALAGLLTRLDAVEASVGLSAAPTSEPAPRFYLDEEKILGDLRFFVRDRQRKTKIGTCLVGDDGVLVAFLSEDTSVGAARAAAKEYSAWLNDMETKKS